jgi:hypothetical protein
VRLRRAELQRVITRTEPLYRRSDTGELTTLRDAPAARCGTPPGSTMTPLHGRRRHLARGAHAGRHVDGRLAREQLHAADDDVHKCWVRHGDPRTGELHVDKNGVTCSAGAGSILSGSYHGFLHNGYLVEC